MFRGQAATRLGAGADIVLVQPETDSPVLELASEGGLFDGRLTEEEALEA